MSGVIKHKGEFISREHRSPNLVDGAIDSELPNHTCEVALNNILRWYFSVLRELMQAQIPYRELIDGSNFCG